MIRLHPAKWWIGKKNSDKIQCLLCPRNCIIDVGQRGFCNIRENINGKLITRGYGFPTGFQIDPIEKKPLYHFYPSQNILSFGTVGCNLDCKFCQNWHLTKSADLYYSSPKYISPETVIDYCKKNNLGMIAFTYNDPNIFGEYIIDVSKLAKENKIKTVMVTAGYVNPEPRKEIYEYIDAVNIDLKSFSEKFYKKFCGAKLETVLNTILWLHNQRNIWMEITTLLIPNENDSKMEIENLTNWIVTNLGTDVPLHFSAFYPSFKMTNYPPTDVSILLTAKQIAQSKGIKYVYLGNVDLKNSQDTFCPKCKSKVIERNRYSTNILRLNKTVCAKCTETIPGRF